MMLPPTSRFGLTDHRLQITALIHNVTILNVCKLLAYIALIQTFDMTPIKAESTGRKRVNNVFVVWILKHFIYCYINE